MCVEFIWMVLLFLLLTFCYFAYTQSELSGSKMSINQWHWKGWSLIWLRSMMIDWFYFIFLQMIMPNDTRQIQWTSMKVLLSLDIYFCFWGIITQKVALKRPFYHVLSTIAASERAPLPISTNTLYKRSIKWYFAALRMQGSPVDWTSAHKLEGSQICITFSHEHHQQLLSTFCAWQQITSVWITFA